MGRSGVRMSEEVQAQILELAKTGESTRTIGEIVGVSRSSVSKVIKRGSVLPTEMETKRAVNKREVPLDEYECEGCGRIVRVRECVFCRDRKALGIEPD